MEFKTQVFGIYILELYTFYQVLNEVKNLILIKILFIDCYWTFLFIISNIIWLQWWRYK